MTEAPFQWNASDYARHSAGQYRWAEELIGKLHLRGHETILDIGCGDGKITARLAEAVPHGSVTGIDLSEEMVALAKQQFSPANFPNLRFVRMDAAQITFEAQFEVAFSNATLHWVKDHRPVLAGVKRALKPGGRLLFQMGGRGNAAEIVRAVDQVRAQPEWAGYFQGFTFPYGFYGPEEYREWLGEAGLKPLRAELLIKDMQHAGREGLTGWFRTTWMPYTTRVPEASREDFIRQVIDAYLARHPIDAQGTAHVEMVRLEVEAENPAVSA